MFQKISKGFAVAMTVLALGTAGPAFGGQMGDEIANDFRSAPIPVTFALGVGGFTVALLATIPTVFTNFRRVDDLYEDMSFGFFRAMVASPLDD
jgi:predicted membrane protein